MGKRYIYMHHQGFDFYFTDHEQSPEECYCSYCEEYDELIGVYEEEGLFAAKLRELFSAGYDVLPCDDYNDIKDKYCPSELRLWENE